MYYTQPDAQFDIEQQRIERWLSDPRADRVVRRRREIQYCYGSGSRANQTPERTAIKAFTAVSANRLRRYIDNFYRDFTGMVTLTYGQEYPMDGRITKRHLRALFERMRRLSVVIPGSECETGEISWMKAHCAVWWIEYQERGAPHIHMLVTGWISKAWLSEAWSEISGAPIRTSTRVEQLKDSETAGSYAAKYAEKADQHQVPPGYENCGRHWGAVGARPAGGSSRVPKVAAATYARAAACVRACARAQMQARAWNREVKDRLNRKDGTAEPQYLLDMPPIYVEGRCLWTVRVYEHDGGYSIYGNEREIDELWRYLQGKCVFTDQTGDVDAFIQPRM